MAGNIYLKIGRRIMCGRYTIGTEGESIRVQEIIEAAGASMAPGLSLTMREGGDVYPTDVAPVIVGIGGESRAVGMRWGFRTERGLVINARAETALERPMFRECALNGRCLLPAAGYYEWNARKERFLFRRSDRGILYLAGLYRTGADGMKEYVILTREARDEARTIHARAPLIVSSAKDWLFNRSAAERILMSDSDPRLVFERQSPEQLSMFEGD
jgi:putative SOS response-associated peptidase YedK